MKNIDIKNKIKYLTSYQDLIPKMLSLLLALTIWMYVNNKKIGEIEFKIPIRIKNFSNEYIVTEQQIQYVGVVIKGNKEEIKTINHSSVRAYIDMTDPILNQPFKYPVKLARNEIPEHIDVQLKVSSVFIRVEKKVEKKIRIVPNFGGSVKNGFFIGNITIVPNEIIAKGPLSIISKIENINTEVISIEDKNNNAEGVVELINPKPGLLTYSSEEVNYFVPIYEAKNVTRIAVPIVVKNVPENKEVIIKPETVSIYLKMMNQTNESILENVTAYIDYSMIKPNEDNIVNIDTGKLKEISVILVKPENVEIKINDLDVVDEDEGESDD